MSTWTSPDQRDAFLVYDRNGNGFIDDGGELFGNDTLLFNGVKAPNGYVALREFDLPANGGNLDGSITAADAIFDHLSVWLDVNQNGVSEPSELQPLSSAGVVAIYLDVRQSPRVDSHGNEFRYLGRALIRVGGKLKTTWTTDVFFTDAE